MAMGRSFKVFHKLPPDRESPYSVIMESKQDDTLMFESGAVVVLSSWEMESVKKQYTKVLDAYGCLGVLSLNVGFDRSTEQVVFIHYLVMVTGCLSVGKIGESEIFKIMAVQFLSLRNDPSDEERIVDVRKLLSSGTFYFSWGANGVLWDLSLCAQRKLQDHDTDNRFFWNRMLHVHFQRYGIDCDSWLLKVMCGGVEVRTVYAAQHQAKACIISRLSCERAGTRFNVRGANDDGHVANFVETEQVIVLDSQVVSFIQIRGSIPLFWEQPGINVGSHKVYMSRCSEASAPAFERHLAMVKQQYGNQTIVNLLGNKEGERKLSQHFQEHHSFSSHKQDIPFIHFDYHSEIKGTNLKNIEKLKARIVKYIKEYDFFYASDINSGNAERQQTGTIRTNCLDCLDRTNAAQTMIGLEVLPKQLECLGLASKPQMVARFEEVYKQMWQHNGDHISRIYTGTGALGGGRPKYTDASRTAARAIQNNFLDNSKQEAIDVLLTGSSLYGDLADKARALLSSRLLHAPPTILQKMIERSLEYTQPRPLRVCVATYNVNGGNHFRSILCKNVSLADWLLEAHKSHPDSLLVGYDYDKPVDIFAVGFEEIVDLNASNIMKASTTNAAEWMKEVQKTVSREHKYVLLTHIQLVGVVLLVYVKPQLAPFIRDVAVDKVKTGLGGATGNKGGVGIRFLVHSTSFCFVCAHLAAGQSQVRDRNEDYLEITQRMAFPMGRTILSHDYVFWCGDFNYRIDLPSEEVKQLIDSQNWPELQKFDQLNEQHKEDKVFQGFLEGPTNFAPTYKYDMFSDDWDTSEKCRTPAWTDRILWRYKPPPGCPGKKGVQLLYNRAELRMSDHRPVTSLFEVEALEVVEERKEQVLKEVVSQQGPPDGTVIVSLAEGGDFQDEVVNAVMEKFTEVGEVIIIRFVESDMWILYKSGEDALEALHLNQQEIGGQKIVVHLKTPQWVSKIEKELRLCSANTGALFNAFTNSLLGDDFSVPASIEYDVSDNEEEEEDGAPGSSMLQVLNSTPSSSRGSSPSPAGRTGDVAASEIIGGPPPRPSQPARPDGPPARSLPPVKGGAALTPLVVAESAAVLRASPEPEVLKKALPPGRPTAPPAKPPPPQRPPGGPAKPSPPLARAAPQASPTNRSFSEMPKVRQPLRPSATATAIARAKKASKTVQISTIGLPTNVRHTSHATTPEEAARLMEMLMRGNSVGGSDNLPPPLKPSASASNLTLENEAERGSLAPKPMPRSRTTQEMDTNTKTASEGEDGAAWPAPRPVPKPLPRAHSIDNISDAGAKVGNPPQPKPRPHRDATSPPAARVVTFLADETAPLSSMPPPIPSARPNQGCGAGVRLVSQMPAIPGRGPPPAAGSQLNLLDAPNSPAPSVPDPFDTSFVRDPFSIRRTPDPFDTSSSSSTQNANSFGDNASVKQMPDPFDTSSVLKQLEMQNSDPFDISPVFSKSAPFSTGSAQAYSSFGEGAFERTSDLEGGMQPFDEGDNSGWVDSPPSTPPPLFATPPSSHPAPSTAPPPPPPRRDLAPVSCPPLGSAAPPVPSRPAAGDVAGRVNGPPAVPSRAGIPPPVPRRPPQQSSS